MSKFKWRKSYWWLVALAMILLFGCWVCSLNRGTKQYPEKSAYLQTYELKQTPDKPVSGKPVTFTFTIKQDGKPLANHKVKIGTSHVYGVLNNPRDEDIVEKVLTTNSEGKASLTYAFKFSSIREDRGFGVYAAQEFTVAEEADFRRKLVEHKIDINTSPAVTYDIHAVYPRWLSWLIWW